MIPFLIPLELDMIFYFVFNINIKIQYQKHWFTCVLTLIFGNPLCVFHLQACERTWSYSYQGCVEWCFHLSTLFLLSFSCCLCFCVVIWTMFYSFRLNPPLFSKFPHAVSFSIGLFWKRFNKANSMAKKYFKAQRYELAAEHYGVALSLCDKLPNHGDKRTALHNNRYDQESTRMTCAGT